MDKIDILRTQTSQYTEKREKHRQNRRNGFPFSLQILNFAGYTIYNFLRKAFHIIKIVLVTIAVLIGAAFITLQSSRVQTFVANKVTAKLKEAIPADIRIGKIHLRPFNTLVLEDVLILDGAPVIPADTLKPKVDTFFRAGSIIAGFSIDGLFTGEGLKVSQAKVKDAQMNLVLEGLTTNLTRIFGLSSSEEKKPRPISEKEIFSIRDVRVEDMGFRMLNFGPDANVVEGTYVPSERKGEAPRQVGIDWTDLEVRHINLRGKNLEMKGGAVTGTVLGMSFRERSGFNCRNLSGETRVGGGKVIVRNIKLRDDFSNLDIPLYMMSFDDVKAFADYINKVKMDGVLGDSFLDFQTLVFFAPMLEGTGLRAKIYSGSVSGPVRDMDIRKVRICLDDGSLAGTVDGHLGDIPDVRKMSIDAKLSGCVFTSAGVDRMVNAWTTEKIDFHKFAKGQRFMMNCRVNGPINNMHIRPEIHSLIGALDADIKFHNLIVKSGPIRMDARLRTKDLDVGKIAGTETVRQCSLETGLKMQLPDERGNKMQISIDSLKVDRLNLMGYDYSRIAAAGEISEDAFDGKFVCGDPNLNFLFQGTFALSKNTNNSLYKFYANVGHADLHALKLDNRKISRLRFRTGADFVRTGENDLIGKIELGGLVLENESGIHDIGDAKLTSITKDGIYRIKFASSFLDALYNGSGSPSEFISDLQKITAGRDLPLLYGDAGGKFAKKNGDDSEDRRSGEDGENAVEKPGRKYDIGLSFHDTRGLLSFLSPGLYIADSTSLRLGISPKGRFTSSIRSSRVAYNGSFLKNFTADFNNDDNNLTGSIGADVIRLGNFASLENSILKIYADDNRMGVGFQYDNKGELDNRGEIYALGELSRGTDGELTMGIRLLPSTVHLNSQRWSIHESEFNITNKTAEVKSFELTSDEQRLSAYGKVSKSAADTLSMELGRFDIGIVNPLVTPDLGLQGKLTGLARLVSPLDDKSILLDVVCDSTYMAGEEIGILAAKCEWDKTFNRFDISADNDINGKNTLSAQARYTPSSKGIEAQLKLDGFNIGYARPFVEEIFNRFEGELSGRIALDGPVTSPGISSEDVRIDNGVLSIAFTNVPYQVSGPVHIDNDGAHFDNVSVTDKFGSTGNVNGAITFGNFVTPGLDLKASVKDLECLDTTPSLSPYFYGHLFASGNVRISGPFSGIVLDIDAVTEKTGNLHIPIPNTSVAGATDLLRFREEEKVVWVDPYEEMMSKLKKQTEESGDFSLNLRVGATPGVTAFVEIDRESGNMLSANGNGQIELKMKGDDFNINGNYNISGGSYKFVALGLASRDFQIKEGSSIRFNGDIMESSLNIDALYKTKASLSTLIADTTSVSTRRTVECGISISDKLKNPRLGFSINVPDIDPTIKSKVESALSTEDKIQKQFLSLIISNSFLPDEQSGIVNSSTLLYSNVSEVMANQLNNILQRLDIPIDLGLNYQPNSKGNDVFDVAVSTQLFNNRVVVNGNIGNRQYKSTGTNTDVVGDIDIEVKLNRSGTLRLNIFSHSADQYTNYLDNSQRNGIGMGYQLEFNGIKDEDRSKLTTLKVEARDTQKVEARDTLKAQKPRKSKLTRKQKKAYTPKSE